jgi:hypothetical protein
MTQEQFAQLLEQELRLRFARFRLADLLHPDYSSHCKPGPCQGEWNGLPPKHFGALYQMTGWKQAAR